MSFVRYLLITQEQQRFAVLDTWVITEAEYNLKTLDEIDSYLSWHSDELNKSVVDYMTELVDNGEINGEWGPQPGSNYAYSFKVIRL